MDEKAKAVRKGLHIAADMISFYRYCQDKSEFETDLVWLEQRIRETADNDEWKESK